MKNISVEAIVLSRINIGEADRLLTVFSLELGKIKILAKGSRRIKSKTASHIEPFTIGKFQLFRGKSFYILTGAERINSCSEGFDCLNSFKHISYLCELLGLAIEEETPEEGIYNLIKEIVFIPKEVFKKNNQIISRYFEFRLLKTLGYNSNYKKCTICNKTIEENEYFLGDFEGVFCCKSGFKFEKINKNTLKILRLFNEKSLPYVLRVKGIEDQNNSLESIVTSYLFDIIPRKPKSIEI